MNRKWRRRILVLAFGTLVVVICTWSYGIYLTDRSLYKPCVIGEECRDKNNDHVVETEIENFAAKIKHEDFQHENLLRTTHKTTIVTTTKHQQTTTQNQEADSETTQNQEADNESAQDEEADSKTTQNKEADNETAQDQEADRKTTQNQDTDDETTQEQHVHGSKTENPTVDASTLQHQYENGSTTQRYYGKSTLSSSIYLNKGKEVFYTPTIPKILWWDFYSGSRHQKNDSITCKGGVKCHSVSSRVFTNDIDTMAIIHYGTNFNFMDLPKKRIPGILWGLIHEESLKNAEYIFNHQEMLSLFNYTATFKRNSDYPLTTHFLPNLEYLKSKKYLVPLKDKNRYRTEEKLAPIFYIQSDCNTPSHREKYVELLQKYIRVDSYGECNNNKELPEYLRFGKSMAAMNHKDFLKLGAKYKFTLAMENAVCDDYITEKLWRPFHLGSVPIVFGSPKIKDFLPSRNSAIVIDDFDDVKDLAAFVQYLDQNDTAYQEYLYFKEKGGITNTLLIDKLNQREWSKYDDMKRPYWSLFNGFECFICEQIHRNIDAVKTGKGLQTKIASVDHYGCPPPKKFNDKGKYVIDNPQRSYFWYEGKYKAKAFRHFYDQHLNYTEKSIEELAKSLRNKVYKNR